jgi:hypothetical protein
VTQTVPRGTPAAVAMRFTEPMHQAIEAGLKHQTRRPLTAGNCNLTRGEFGQLDLSCGRADVGAWPVGGLKCRLETAGGRRSVTLMPRILPGTVLWGRRGQAGEGAKRANARVLLRVLEVRATRLLEITEADALAEGVLVFCPPAFQGAVLEQQLAQAYDFQLQQLGKKYGAQWRAGEVHSEVVGATQLRAVV